MPSPGKVGRRGLLDAVPDTRGGDDASTRASSGFANGCYFCDPYLKPAKPRPAIIHMPSGQLNELSTSASSEISHPPSCVRSAAKSQSQSFVIGYQLIRRTAPFGGGKKRREWPRLGAQCRLAVHYPIPAINRRARSTARTELLCGHGMSFGSQRVVRGQVGERRLSAGFEVRRLRGSNVP